MQPIAEKGGNVATAGLDGYNLDIYIKECGHCALTCRTWAEAYKGGAKKLAESIDACLECARICEATARALLLHKQGVKGFRDVQIEACVMTCRVCARQCQQQAAQCEGLSVCANVATHCEETMRMLLRPKISQRNKSGFLAFVKTLVGR
jgi:hypothetical protein